MLRLARIFLYALGVIMWSVSALGFSCKAVLCFQDTPEDLHFVVLALFGMFLCYPFLFYCGRMVVYVAKGGTE